MGADMNARALKSLVPWWARIPAKMVLSRLPVSTDTWRKLRLFQLGSMNRGEYVWFVFERHLAELLEPGAFDGKTLLELGPGDGVASGLLASCLGAERSILVDAGDFASRDLKTYRAMIEDWRAHGLPVRHLEDATTFDELCEAGRTTYLTRGLDSLRELEDASVDVQLSNAVLEHVRVDELDATFVELARILKPNGFGRHAVDLRDHLGGALNHLRFEPERWESKLFTRSGFYTNRVRFGDMLARIRSSGVDARVTKTWTWSSLPTPRAKLAEEFRHVREDDLRVWGFDVEVRPLAVAATVDPGLSAGVSGEPASLFDRRHRAARPESAGRAV